MSQPDIVVPIATDVTNQCTITAPWFIQQSEYKPMQATYMPLVNGEEAFAAVHRAIADAKKSVDIICWGFQPSMYFIRDGKAPCIGELLNNIAREKGVQVRILGWEAPFNSAGYAGEANLPGKGAIRVSDRAGQSASDKQYAYDRQWFKEHSYKDEWMDLFPVMIFGVLGKGAQNAVRHEKLRAYAPVFVGRGFGAMDRAEIAYRASQQATDKDISGSTVSILTLAPTHHQKTVLVDYELPDDAVGFVMGHNMLDEYWDTDKHSAQHRGNNKLPPNAGPRGHLPRQDISSRVTGPILEHLHENFATAWCKETGQDLLTLRKAKDVAKKLRPRADYGTPLMAQLLRTQEQEKRRDIEKLYLNAVNNATQFIYIENQYFRWPSLSEAIKEAISNQIKCGRNPDRDGYLHLFVVTNVTDEGIGPGTVNTQRMLESLGRADTIPKITKLRKIEKLRNEMFKASDSPPRFYIDPADMNQHTQEALEHAQERLRKQAEFEKKAQEIQDSEILQVDIPGLKVHICSLVAQDSPAEKWMPVYIHSKLMIINDVFTTHGSANINTRSMQVDSEMNIAHDWASVTQALRRRLWKLHTKEKGMQDESAKAFEAWDDLLTENQKRQYPRDEKEAPQQPLAPLIQFQYNKNELKDQD
ncbi:phospholipase D-like domain-containing protein [Rouxiella sp. Mn2063]|uniref:phospholipase D-like domain-containing protein n=1 Tax=Rouxiella sp. Mn2063 TaxID=3395262 RepID=UPI003BBF0055